MGTLSKAFGSLGGFVGCSSAMKQLLLNRGRTFVYSTSLPVPVVEAAGAALRVSRRWGPAGREGRAGGDKAVGRGGTGEERDTWIEEKVNGRREGFRRVLMAARGSDKRDLAVWVLPYVGVNSPHQSYP